MNHFFIMLILSVLILILGVHMAIARKFWVEKYLTSLDVWGIHLSPRTIFGIVILTALIATISGILLGLRAVTGMLH